MKLTEAKKGKYIVTHVFGEYKMKIRLANLGFYKGQEIKVMKSLAGMSKVKVNGYKLFLGRGICGRVEVEKV